MSDYYTLLGIPRCSSLGDIKKAYHEKAMQLHPDKGHTTEAMVELNEAMRVLRDPSLRIAYDKQLYKQIKKLAKINRPKKKSKPRNRQPMTTEEIENIIGRASDIKRDIRISEIEDEFERII